MSELAILGGSPVHTGRWVIWPTYGEEELKQLKDVLDQIHGLERLWGGVMPCPKNRELEETFSAYHQCHYGVSVSNGTAAIELALLAAGLQVGDEVLTTPMTWVATSTAILRAGGVPIFVDVEPETYTINPELLEEAITSRTKAIMPVHLSGYPARMDRIMAVAEKHDLVVVEDCAQAHGVEYNGQKVGSFGNVATFSFYQSKLVASGEGGIIITDDYDIWQKCASYRDVGRLRRQERDTLQGTSEWYHDYLEAYEEGGWGLGWNYRLTEFQAGLILAQMERLDEHREIRFRNATWLNEQLEDIEGIRPAPLREGQDLWRYTIEYDPEFFEDVPLRTMLAALQAEGIPAIHFHPRPNYKEGLFRGFIERSAWSPGLMKNPYDYTEVRCPEAEKAFNRLIILNSNVLLGDREDMEDIVLAFRKLKLHAGELIGAKALL
jgi:dTDP-4-amino-4,6-dideoxygalactose transaminase